MPPMTVVVPSLTWTRVFARCVLIWTLLPRRLTGAGVLDHDLHDHGVRGGDLRRHAQRQRGVLVGDCVRCIGGRRRDQGNLHALHDFGFDVVLRRHARRREHAALAGRSSADSATSRLNAPLTAPSAMPIAEFAAGAGELTRCWCSVPESTVRIPRAEPSTDRARIRECEVGRVSDLGRHAAVEAPLDADRAGEITGGRDDPRLDFHLRLGAIE